MNDIDITTDTWQVIDRAIKQCDKLSVDPTPIAIYLVIKTWRDRAVSESYDEYTVRLLELSMITQLKEEMEDAGL